MNLFLCVCVCIKWRGQCVRACDLLQSSARAYSMAWSSPRLKSSSLPGTAAKPNSPAVTSPATRNYGDDDGDKYGDGRCGLVFPTWRRVDENDLQVVVVFGPSELLQVGIVEPGRLHSSKAGSGGCVHPLREVRQLGEQPADVGAEAKSRGGRWRRHTGKFIFSPLQKSPPNFNVRAAPT